MPDVTKDILLRLKMDLDKRGIGLPVARQAAASFDDITKAITAAGLKLEGFGDQLTEIQPKSSGLTFASDAIQQLNEQIGEADDGFGGLKDRFDGGNLSLGKLSAGVGTFTVALKGALTIIESFELVNQTVWVELDSMIVGASKKWQQYRQAVVAAEDATQKLIVAQAKESGRVDLYPSEQEMRKKAALAFEIVKDSQTKIADAEKKAFEIREKLREDDAIKANTLGRKLPIVAGIPIVGEDLASIRGLSPMSGQKRKGLEAELKGLAEFIERAGQSSTAAVEDANRATERHLELLRVREGLLGKSLEKVKETGREQIKNLETDLKHLETLKKKADAENERLGMLDPLKKLELTLLARRAEKKGLSGLTDAELQRAGQIAPTDAIRGEIAKRGDRFRRDQAAGLEALGFGATQSELDRERERLGTEESIRKQLENARIQQNELMKGILDEIERVKAQQTKQLERLQQIANANLDAAQA